MAEIEEKMIVLNEIDNDINNMEIKMTELFSLLTGRETEKFHIMIMNSTEFLHVLQTDLPADFKLPHKVEIQNIGRFYQLSKVNMGIYGGKIIFSIKIPLVDKNDFFLSHLSLHHSFQIHRNTHIVL